MTVFKNDVVSWSLKNILLSLLPFLIGATFRMFYWGKISFEVFDPSELAFSMAILYIIVLQSVSMLDDDNLKSSLSSIIQLGIFVSIAFFACALLLKIHLDTQLFNQFNAFEEISKTDPGTIPNLIKIRMQDSFYLILNRVNWASVGLSVLSIPFVIGMKSKYKLT